MRKTVLTLSLSLLLALGANAQIFNGSTLGDPTWNRPLPGNPPTQLSLIGTAVPFEVIEFTLSVAGLYTFQNTATNPVGWDNVTFLYQNSFSPTDQLTNVLIGNDDNPTVGLSGFTINLSAGVTYFFVTTGFSNNEAGDYTLAVTGPAAVPEPGSLALASLGLVGFVVLVARRHRRGYVG